MCVAIVHPVRTDWSTLNHAFGYPSGGGRNTNYNNYVRGPKSDIKSSSALREIAFRF
ncbi:hypothetical protein B0J17DRAFT_663779 [Rhizoctonia solani]|nr:hypothetical protein B0J17DRAFT_663779 [Rhizoctonia solani]